MTAPFPGLAHLGRATRTMSLATSGWAFKTRYVRTPAGARRYGVPIGSPIPVGRRVKPSAQEGSGPKRRTVRTEAGAQRYGVPVGSQIPLGRRVKGATPAQPAGGYRPAPRRSADDWPDTDRDRIGDIEQPDDRDARLSAVLAEQGFDGPPTVVDSDTFDQLPDDHRRLYRGIAGAQAADHADQFRNGELFTGLGAYGNGTYTTTDPDAAQGYAAGRGWRGADEDGQVVRMALRPDARVATLEDIRTAMANDPRLAGKAFGDPGRAAAALGYDALWMQPDRGEPERYYVVLNRTALIVEA